MARRAPSGPPATVWGWVYTLCLDPPYPTPACENGHQVGHYTGISKLGLSGLPGRMAVQAEGGSDAARLMQVQREAGGTFHLVTVEWGTQDLETAHKYRAATDRCWRCTTDPPPPGEQAPEMGWVCILHLEPPHARKAAPQSPKWQEPEHSAVFIASTESMYAALGRGGRDVASVSQMPEAHGGTWRLTKAEWAAADPTTWFTSRSGRRRKYTPGFFCPDCRAAKAQAEAGELLAAIERGEVAHRFSPPSESWAARWFTRDGQPIVSDGPDGALGRNVTQTAAALVRRGLAKRAPAPPPGVDSDTQYADRPYLITSSGRESLRAARTGRARPASRRPGWRGWLPGIRAVASAAPPRPRPDGLPIRHDGGLNLAKCTDAQRARAGVMTRAQAKAHKELLLSTLNGSRANRVYGPLGTDLWTTPAAPPGRPAEPGPGGSLNGFPAAHPGGASQQDATIVTLRPPVPARRPAADPSWPSAVSDGVVAAADLAAARARRPRTPAGRTVRGSAPGAVR